MIYVPKVAHTNFSLAYPLNLFSPEKSLGHRQHPSTLSCLELAFLVDTTCISLFSISVRRCFFIGNPRVIHIDSLWSSSREFVDSKPWFATRLRRGVFSGLPLGLFPCGFQWSACRVMEVFGFLHVVNPSPSSYIRCWFVFFQSSFRIFSVHLNLGIGLKRLLVLSRLLKAFSNST